MLEERSNEAQPFFSRDCQDFGVANLIADLTAGNFFPHTAQLAHMDVVMSTIKKRKAESGALNVKPNKFSKSSSRGRVEKPRAPPEPEPSESEDDDETDEEETPTSGQSANLHDRAGSNPLESPSVETENEQTTRAAITGHQVTKTFADLGVREELCDACEALKYTSPTPIQVESIPLALEGRDVIGLAETGSGKTAAFVLPILQSLLEKPQALFGLVLAPTRELAYQIAQQVDALGSIINVKCATLVGGMDMVPQAIALSKRPHIVVATPGMPQSLPSRVTN